MDFNWSTQQLRFRDEVTEFATSLNNDVVERDKNSEFSRTNWQACAEFGIQGMAVPTEFGGTGRADILTGMLAMEAMGLTCRDMGFLFALNAQMWTVQLLSKNLVAKTRSNACCPLYVAASGSVLMP